MTTINPHVCAMDKWQTDLSHASLPTKASLYPKSFPAPTAAAHSNLLPSSSFNSSSVSSLDSAALNQLVINWMVVEGYQQVAEVFQQETGTKSAIPLSSISARTAVRNSISRGDIDNALTQIEALSPELLESSPTLLLQLRQQKLVELIRAGHIDQSLEYARLYLREGCANESEFLHQMECIMSLLAFSVLPISQNPMKYLLDQQQRVQLSNRVNERILEQQFTTKESQLSAIIKQLHASQKILSQYHPNFPSIDCSTAVTDPTPNSPSNSSSPSIPTGPVQFPLSSVAIGSSSSSAPFSSAASSSTSSTLTASGLPPLLDPVSVFETAAAKEAAERAAAEAAAAAAKAAFEARLEKERAEKDERETARRLRQARVALSRPSGVRFSSSSGGDGSSAAEEQDEEEDDDEDEQHHLHNAEEDEDEEEGGAAEESESEDEEMQH